MTRNLSFQLHDITGKLVSSFQPKTFNTTCMLDVEKYESGTYSLSLMVDGEVVQSENMVKH